MEIQNILIFLLVFDFVSAKVVTRNETESYVSLFPLKYEIKLEFILNFAPTTSTNLYSTPGVFTITAEALSSSNQFWIRKISHTLTSRKVNVTNLTEKKTMLVSNVTSCTENDQILCVLLDDSFQAGDHLEIVISNEFSMMSLYTYDDYDSSTNIMQRKFYGNFNLANFAPAFYFRDGQGVLSKPRVTLQFTIGLGGMWKNSHKIIGISNSLGETNSLSNNTRWTHFEESPPIDFEHVQIFITDFVNYTVSTQRNHNVSVWGPPNIIFQNGTIHGSPTAFANFTASFASSILKSYEKTLDIKYPLDGLQLGFLNSSWTSFSPKHPVLGQVYLNQREFNAFFSTSAVVKGKQKIYLMQLLARLVYAQFMGIMVDEPLDFSVALDLSEYIQSFLIQSRTGVNIYGSSIVNMLEGFLTPEMVLNGIRIYTKYHSWKRAKENYFFEALEESISRQNSTDLFLPTGVKMKDVIGNFAKLKWFDLQINASFLHPDSNYIQLTVGSQHGDKIFNLKRWFPVQVKLALSLENSTEILKETFWVPPNTSVHNITTVGGHALTNAGKIQWLLVDKNWDGVNSVFYDQTLLSRLVSQLNQNCSVFLPRERYNILFNGGIFHLRSKIPLENFFLLTSYFGQETESEFWSSAMRKLLGFKFLYLGNDETYEETRKHFVPKIESYLKARGGLEKMVDKDEGLISFWFQEACLLLRAPSCLRFASDNLQKFEFKRKWQASHWFEAAGADPENFEYLKQRFFNALDKGKGRKKYFTALEWTRNDTLYETFLNSVLEKNSKALRFTRYGSSMEVIVLSESRLTLLVNFSKTKFEQKKISSFLFANFAHYVFNFFSFSGVVSDKNLYEDLKLFINENEGKLKAKHYDSLQYHMTLCDEEVYSSESYWNKNGEAFLLWLKKFNQEGYTMA